MTWNTHLISFISCKYIKCFRHLFFLTERSWQILDENSTILINNFQSRGHLDLKANCNVERFSWLFSDTRYWCGACSIWTNVEKSSEIFINRRVVLYNQKLLNNIFFIIYVVYTGYFRNTRILFSKNIQFNT